MNVVAYIDDRKYEIKFGIKQLINLKNFLSIEEDREIKSIFCSTIVSQDCCLLSYSQKEALFDKLLNEFGIDYIKDLLSRARAQSLGDNSNITNNLYEDFFTRAVGEMGMRPDDFYMMTPHEITLAYKGYLYRKQLEMNGMLLALKKSRAGSRNLISIVEEEGVRESTIEEREDTFRTLGIIQ